MNETSDIEEQRANARRLIAEEKQLREDACLKAINETLARFQCSIDPVIEMRQDSSGEYRTRVILRTVAV